MHRNTCPSYKLSLPWQLVALLLVSWIPQLTAQPVPTFEASIPGIPAITNLQAIPGTNQFYACTQKNYPDRIAPVVMKMDVGGNILQQREYNLPGIGWIIATRIKADGGLLLIGVRNFEQDSVYCLSLQPNGNVGWYKAFYLAGQSITASDILEASDGTILISGSILLEDFRHQPFLLKLDQNGNQLWMKQFSSEAGKDAPGGGIIQRNDVIIFCSSIETDDYPGPHNIRLNRVSLADGSLVSVKDLLPEDVGFDQVKIYDDLHGGYYIYARSFIYRSPCQTAYVLRLDSNLQLLNNYSIANTPIPQGFGVLNDGILYAGRKCLGYAPGTASSTLTKVSPEGQVIFSGRYPGALTKPPFSPDTLVIISDAISIGNQALVSGRKNGQGFVSSLNNLNPGQNNCSLLNNNAAISSQQFTTAPASWAGVLNKTVATQNLPVAITDLALTPEITSCTVLPVLYVDQHASGLNNGSSWQNAYTSFTDAIHKMNTVAGIDFILVAAGTYTPAPDTAFIFSKLHAVILGGYPTGGGARNPSVNPVILQGEVHFEQSVRFDGFKL